MSEQGIAPPWLALFRKHPDRFVFGGDTFFLAESVPSESPLHVLGRGNENRLKAAAQLVSRLPSKLAKKLAEANPARLYRL